MAGVDVVGALQKVIEEERLVGAGLTVEPGLGLILPVLEQAACQAAAAPEQSSPKTRMPGTSPGISALRG